MKLQISAWKHDPAPHWWDFFITPTLSVSKKTYKHYRLYYLSVSWMLWSAFIECEILNTKTTE